MKKKRKKLKQGPVNILKPIVSTGLESQISENTQGLIFDFSFAELFHLIECTQFLNMCENESDFITSFLDAHNLICKLSHKSLQKELIQGRYRHCHAIDEKEKREVVEKALYQVYKDQGQNTEDAENRVVQLIGNERLYQLGFEGAVRLIGIETQTDVFKVLLFDFHHNLYPNQTKKEYNPKKCKFSPHKLV